VAAVYDDPESQRLRTALGGLRWHRFVVLVSAERATAPIGLLLMPHALRDALAMVISRAGLPRVQAVLVLGGHAGVDSPLAVADELRSRARADAVCVAAVPTGHETRLIDALLVELSHDLDLDVAFAAACRGANLPPPLMVAAEGSFARAHLGVWGHRIAERMVRTPTMRLPLLGISHLATPGDVARELATRLPSFAFDSEGHEATYLAELGHAARLQPPPVAHRERRAQARLFDVGGAERVQVDRAPLVPRLHQLEVWIGPVVTDSLVAPSTFPEDQLPRKAELAVILTAPALGAEPQVRKLALPPVGPSKYVHFDLAIRESIRRLEARITFLHENRVLQTLLLLADVGPGEPAPLALGIETVVRRDLDGVSGRRRFDVALIQNQLAGQRMISIFADNRASLVPAGGQISKLSDDVGNTLEEATNNAKKYGAPPTQGTTDLLASLARKGSLLLDALREMGYISEKLIEARRIQIISANPYEPTLPLEICYDGAAPAVDAKMCSQWQAALATGACQPACPLDRSTVVCPVAFWGLSRTIERHAFARVDAAKLGANSYALQSEPSDGRARLAVSPGSICAAASAARAVDPGSVDDAFAKAREVAKSADEVEVKDWTTWKAAITHNPAILVMLAHTDEKGGVSTLVIGAKDTVFLSSIDPSYVGAGAGHGPIALLLGCDTAVTVHAFQSFVAKFRFAGAAIVIGTLCEILGQHAGPIATQILTELGRASATREGAPLGDLMTAVRRQVLADGYPIVMAVAAYGDADWLI
jgi:hypothetical protein